MIRPTSSSPADRPASQAPGESLRINILRPPDAGPSYFDGLDRPAPANFPVQRIKLPHTGPISAGDVPDGDIVLATWWETVEWAAALPASKGAKVHFMQDYEIWAGHIER